MSPGWRLAQSILGYAFVGLIAGLSGAFVVYGTLWAQRRCEWLPGLARCLVRYAVAIGAVVMVALLAPR